MDRSPHHLSSDGSQICSSSSSAMVLSIERQKGKEWAADKLQTGDIVEELRIGTMTVNSPFKNGKSGVQRILHNSFKQKETAIHVRVRRGADTFAELQACVVPAGDQFLMSKRQYVLRAVDDPDHTVGFLDRPESECLELQASRTARMARKLETTQLQDGHASYPWARKMKEMLPVANSSNLYSILFLPKASDVIASSYNDLEDTLARAHTWINASQVSGAPIVFMSIQTESLLTKVSGEAAAASSAVKANSLADLSNLSATSLYGFEDYHGVDIGVVRAVRMWFSPLGEEFPVEIRIKETDTKLGFAISRTAEGFIYISSVIDGVEDTPSSRSGLNRLYNQASGASLRLVVSRISNQKVLPWLVSSTGAIRCFDTVSLSRKMSLHRHTRVPILVHVLLTNTDVPNYGKSMVTPFSGSTSSVSGYGYRDDEEFENSTWSEERKTMPERDDISGEFSFRSHDWE